MALIYEKSMQNGNPLIDSEHRQLLETINNLLEACAIGNDKDRIKVTAYFFNDYVIKHCADEEKLQLQTGYPYYEYHKKLHDEFKKIVTSLIEELNRNEPPICFEDKINADIVSWLFNHFRTEDKKLAAHVNYK